MRRRGGSDYSPQVSFRPALNAVAFHAFRSSAAPTGFPYLTGREQEAMLLFRPTYRRPERMAKLPNLEEAEALAPGATPLPPEHSDLEVEVETPGESGSRSTPPG